MKTRLAALVDETGLLKKDFAEKIEVSTGNLSDWLSGRTEPSAKVLSRICEIFDVNLNWLISGKGSMFLSKSPESIKSKQDDLQAQVDELKKQVKELSKKHRKRT